MELIEFEEQTVVIAKDQPQYNSMPAWKRENDETGTTVVCWNLSLKERLKLLLTGKVWHLMMTFNKPTQPQLLQIDKPEF